MTGIFYDNDFLTATSKRTENECRKINRMNPQERQAYVEQLDREIEAIEKELSQYEQCDFYFKELAETEYKASPMEDLIITLYKNLVFLQGVSEKDALAFLHVKKVTDKVVITGKEDHSEMYDKMKVIEKYGDAVTNPYSPEEIKAERAKHGEGWKEEVKRPKEKLSENEIDHLRTGNILSWLEEYGMKFGVVSAEKEEKMIAVYKALDGKEKVLLNAFLARAGIRKAMEEIDLNDSEMQAMKKNIIAKLVEVL